MCFKRVFLTVAAVFVFGMALAVPASHAVEQPTQDDRFQSLLGWWQGQGRLLMREGKPETVKCRATYRFGETKTQLLQAVRCATSGGKVEVKSEISNTGGELKGTWTETVYELAGELTGEFTPKGFRVKVSGSDLKARMDVRVRDDQQIVEIQFHDSTLIGMTMVFNRGRSR
ncbi:MAG: hypothetical protein RIC14_14325 [Filomicrobium sp.]